MGQSLSHPRGIIRGMQTPEPPDPDIVTYKPSVFYFRKALREAVTLAKAVAIGMALCRELEQLKAWVREQGLYPPKWTVPPEEAAEKGWGIIIPMPGQPEAPPAQDPGELAPIIPFPSPALPKSKPRPATSRQP